MQAELFFIYDSHCPWSYATNRLVNEVAKTMPQVKIHFWHAAYFEGDTNINQRQLDSVTQLSGVKFSAEYVAKEEETKDSTLAANLLAWADIKSPKDTYNLLNALQDAHFNHGNPLTSAEDVTDIISSLKLSPPTKALTNEKLTKDAENNIHQIFELQDIIGTKAIPALLVAVDDNLVLLNHNLYLLEPKAIIDAIKLELK